MKIWVLSDLHLEFEDWSPTHVPDADVAVLAGDIGKSPARALDWARDHVAAHMPAVVVAGNHEFYRGMVQDRLGEARDYAANLSDVHFLEDDYVVLGGVRLVGATLWTDFALGAETAADVAWNGRAAEGMMSDYSAIRGLRKQPFRKLFAPDTAKMHAASRRFIEQVLAHPFNGPSVVVTHHAPHPKSVAERFRDSGLNSAFVSDLGDTIERYEPDLWVHGHVHDSFDYRVGGTRVVCNPRGYHGENAEWCPELVVEV